MDYDPNYETCIRILKLLTVKALDK